MQTWSLNSKKCSTAKGGALLALCLFSSLASASVTGPASDSVLRNIVQDIHRRNSASFDGLLSIWEKHYGTRAVPALLQVAKDRSQLDPDRYVAIMGVAKIGGTESAPLLAPLLKDPSWMIRNGTLRALAALGNPATAQDVLPLLSDIALVVRLEAVHTIEKLRPTGAESALIAAVRNPENYHAGRAQWVPQHALTAIRHLQSQKILTSFESREAASKLTALLANPPSYQKDSSLKPEIEATLRMLTAAN
jgi:HEAT repeat protein